MKIGDRVSFPNPDGETMFDQTIEGTIIETNGVYMTIQTDDGEVSPYAWVVEDGVELVDNREETARKRWQRFDWANAAKDYDGGPVSPLPMRVPDPPSVEEVNRELEHGHGWVLIYAGDQGEDAPDIDRFVAVYECREGYRADWFYFSGSWSLGAS